MPFERVVPLLARIPGGRPRWQAESRAERGQEGLLVEGFLTREWLVRVLLGHPV